MQKSLVIALLLAVGSSASAAQQPASSANTQAHGRHRAHKSGPGTALTPALATSHSAPAPSAVVSYQNGLLTITAENGRLRDLLDRVRDATGIAIDAPMLNEHVTARLGPELPAQVISQLLEEAHVSYVIVGDLTDSKTVRAILVISPSAAGPEPAPPPPPVDIEAAATRAKALVVAETGGDEGVGDDVEVGVPIVPSQPASTPAEPRPAQAVPASAPSVAPGQH